MKIGAYISMLYRHSRGSIQKELVRLNLKSHRTVLGKGCCHKCPDQAGAFNSSADIVLQVPHTNYKISTTDCKRQAKTSIDSDAKT